jgi:hypothetical protein
MKRHHRLTALPAAAIATAITCVMLVLAASAAATTDMPGSPEARLHAAQRISQAAAAQPTIVHETTPAHNNNPTRRARRHQLLDPPPPRNQNQPTSGTTHGIARSAPRNRRWRGCTSTRASRPSANPARISGKHSITISAPNPRSRLPRSASRRWPDRSPSNTTTSRRPATHETSRARQRSSRDVAKEIRSTLLAGDASARQRPRATRQHRSGRPGAVRDEKSRARATAGEVGERHFRPALRVRLSDW